MTGEAGSRYALSKVHQAEDDLVEHLVAVAERHATEHEVHHVALDLARWSREHLAAVAGTAQARGIDLDPHPHGPSRVSRAAQRATAVMGGRRPEPGVLLLEDVEQLYLLASAASLAWELLGQHAKAQRDADLLGVVTTCHPRTLRQVRWANTTLRTVSPQVLGSL
ncbi:MAG: hypothetical protein ACTHMS_21760 [Jatrophihabitans sp.]|uniref:hypothetical protein n=1 Tax=Jatrophihabitans sp. TaxID=1932789 RepID=UPI003F81DD19